MKYDPRYPSVSDLKARARRRIPAFAFDYIDAAIDEERGKQRNRESFHALRLTPRYLADVTETDISAAVFGRRYDMPIGVSPVGLGNMMWPGAEKALAAAAQEANVPYVLSTFSTTSMEEIVETAPGVSWFQLYVPRDPAVMKDIVARATEAGFNALVVTLDIPVGAKRNREIKNGLKLPLGFKPKIVWQSLRHPAWATGQLRRGTPNFVNVLRYKKNTGQGLAEFITEFMMWGVTLDRVAEIRRLWDGPLILKGILHAQNALDAVRAGVDGIVVSNHGGRQLDAAPSSVDALRALPPGVRENVTVMIDSGIRTGLDVVRCRALGAEFTFSGRSFCYGVGALGPLGGRQVVEIYRDEITRTLKQLGCASFDKMDATWLTDQPRSQRHEHQDRH